MIKNDGLRKIKTSLFIFSLFKIKIEIPVPLQFPVFILNDLSRTIGREVEGPYSL